MLGHGGLRDFQPGCKFGYPECPARIGREQVDDLEPGEIAERLEGPRHRRDDLAEFRALLAPVAGFHEILYKCLLIHLYVLRKISAGRFSKRERGLFLRYDLVLCRVDPVGHGPVEQVKRIDLHVDQILETECLELVPAIRFKGDHDVVPHLFAGLDVVHTVRWEREVMKVTELLDFEKWIGTCAGCWRWGRPWL